MCLHILNLKFTLMYKLDIYWPIDLSLPLSRLVQVVGRCQLHSLLLPHLEGERGVWFWQLLSVIHVDYRYDIFLLMRKHVFAEICAKFFYSLSNTQMPFRTSGRYSSPIEVWSRVIIQDYATKLFCRQWPPLRVPIKNYACLGKTILSCRVVLRFSVGFRTW